jgi:hypothetical protein
MSTTTIERKNTEMTTTNGVNAILSDSVSISIGTAGTETFGFSIRQAYHEGKLDGLIQRAEADYKAGKALDTLD